MLRFAYLIWKLNRYHENHWIAPKYNDSCPMPVKGQGNIILAKREVCVGPSSFYINQSQQSQEKLVYDMAFYELTNCAILHIDYLWCITLWYLDEFL